MTQEANTFERVRKIITEHLDAHTGGVTPDTRFFEDLACDSLDNIELVMALEEEFDHEIPDADAEQLRTVGDAVALIDRLIAGEAVA